MKNLKMTLGMILGTAVFLTSCDDDDKDATPSMVSVYTTNNSDGNINIYISGSSMTMTTLTTSSTAADGAYFDGTSVYQVSRSKNSIEGFAVTADASLGGVLDVSASLTSTSDMTSPRELAVNGDMYVVADNADADGNADTKDGRLFVYQKSGNNFTLRNTITTDIKLWGITFIGNDLYAVVDTENKLAVYTNFLSNMSSTSLSASKTVAIEGLVRTHGLTYDSMTGTMVLTDIAAASDPENDGGIHIINDFMSKFNGVASGGTIALSDQIRISGSNTKLGNPVDVAYDGQAGVLYIAEAGNGGGRILAFSNIGSGGNLTPSMNQSLAAASSVYLYKK
ncbi:hypothetical protein [Arcticibacterium luteifluviistationis]|uniref:Uncharacterized protein n=1 Tax=Arcticibacterium luteifluviistationis TaxID=1784714 RepID=A0A2Z4G7T6_9BACT|nr:hypothetical protein [Arcticibacterium luteifluviistationis]AWV97217.1 hypothetical protein DJ013_03140 [Arcticibacterium luteifluviistationis]